MAVCWQAFQAARRLAPTAYVAHIKLVWEALSRSLDCSQPLPAPGKPAAPMSVQSHVNKPLIRKRQCLVNLSITIFRGSWGGQNRGD